MTLEHPSESKWQHVGDNSDLGPHAVHSAPNQRSFGASRTSTGADMALRLKSAIRTSVILPEDAQARIQALAVANDVSAAWVIRQAVLKFLDQHRSQTDLPLRL